MNALRATAALLAGAALTLAIPVQAQWSREPTSGGSAIMMSPAALRAAGSERQVRIFRGTSNFTERAGHGGISDGSQERLRRRRGRSSPHNEAWGGIYVPSGGDYHYNSPGLGPDRGYFSQSGERPLISNGQARFDYDRSYPYEYYYEEPSEDMDRSIARAEPSCEMNWTRNLATGDLVPVRVCRN